MIENERETVMKKAYLGVLVSLCLGLSGFTTFAQSGGIFEIKKSVIAGGGGNSLGGSFVLDGTIAQPSAGVGSSGGTFLLTVGFWGGAVAPASSVRVSGRVTSPGGFNLSGVRVSMIDQLGVRRIATTSSFGIYFFDNVSTGQNYTLTAASKRYRFAPLILLVNNSLTDVNFVGLE